MTEIETARGTVLTLLNDVNEAYGRENKIIKMGVLFKYLAEDGRVLLDQKLFC